MIPQLAYHPGTVAPATTVAPAHLAPHLTVGQTLTGEVVRVVSQGRALVNLQGQHVMLDLGPQVAQGQTLRVLVVQVTPTPVLQLVGDAALLVSTPSEVVPQTNVPGKGQGEGTQATSGGLSATQLKTYLAARQPLTDLLTTVERVLANTVLAPEVDPALRQRLQETLAILQPEHAFHDAAHLQAQVDRSGLQYESKVQHVLQGHLPATELAQDLKGQLLDLAQRLEPLTRAGSETQAREAAEGLRQIHRALDTTELRQLCNQLALQEHRPLVLPLAQALTSPPQTMHLTVQRHTRDRGATPPDAEEYTAVLLLNLTALGNLQLEARIQGTTVSTTITAEDARVAEFLDTAAPELYAQLQALGFHAAVVCTVQPHIALDPEEPCVAKLLHAAPLHLVDIIT